MAAEDHGLAPGAEVLHALHAFALEGHVAHGKRLVDYEDVGTHQSGDGEGQPHEHPR